MAQSSLKPITSTASKLTRAQLNNQSISPTDKEMRPRIGGSPTNAITQPDTYKINAAKTRLNLSKGPYDTSTLNKTALTILNLLVEGSISLEKKQFSLLDISKDTELIDNENILDSQAFQNKPEAVSPTDKFPGSDNAFYELDDDIPRDYALNNESKAKNNKPDVSCFIADVAARMLRIEEVTSSTTEVTKEEIQTTTTTGAPTTTAGVTMTTTTTY